MSHFTVLVVGENYEKQLAPYQENNMGDCPKEYLKFYDETDDLLKEYNEESQEMVRDSNGDLISRYDNRASSLNNPEIIKVPFKQIYSTFDEFAQKYHGYEKKDENGRYGYWENPNRKWDWYKVGGRWRGFFKLKKEAMDGATEALIGKPGIFNNDPIFDADICRKGDIDWEGMKKDKIIESEQLYEEYKEKDGEDKGIFAFTYDIRDGESKEDYIKRQTITSTYAVVKDGKWYERGEMGWWGISKDKMSENEWHEQFNKLIENLSDDTLLTLVDCHI